MNRSGHVARPSVGRAVVRPDVGLDVDLQDHGSVGRRDVRRQKVDTGHTQTGDGPRRVDRHGQEVRVGQPRHVHALSTETYIGHAIDDDDLVGGRDVIDRASLSSQHCQVDDDRRLPHVGVLGAPRRLLGDPLGDASPSVTDHVCVYARGRGRDPAADDVGTDVDSVDLLLRHERGVLPRLGFCYQPRCSEVLLT
jgi:hypothetical protein